ncbi:MAG: biotin--[acetyl-CoA-carboxylase] ligase [Chitinophagaceae bacterium]
MPHPSFQNNIIGEPFVELESVDSTNNYALTQVYAGLAQHGTAFFAHEQVAGKGQRGKSWTSEKNSNLITSILMNPDPLILAHQFQLSACVAISACECLKKYAGDDMRIKWPNDLYWQDRKAGGVLIENVIGAKKMTDDRRQMGGIQGKPTINDYPSSNWLWAVAGVGININQAGFPAHLANPVSLKQITGKTFNPIDLAKELYLILDRNWKHLAGQGFENIYSYYQQQLYKKNELVRFKKGNRSFEAVVKGVSLAGSLVVQHAIEEEITVGEVEWLLPAIPPRA